jgi:hypothetical protein
VSDAPPGPTAWYYDPIDADNTTIAVNSATQQFAVAEPLDVRRADGSLRPTMLLLALNQEAPDYLSHSDGHRTNATRALYDTRVLTVGSQGESDANPFHLHRSFDRSDVWKPTRPSRMAAGGLNDLGAILAILDYFFLVREYFDPREDKVNGYSDEWFRCIAPTFIREGPGEIMLLPHDRWGMLDALHAQSAQGLKDQDIGVTLLTLRETQQYHPLWRATDVGAKNDIVRRHTLRKCWHDRGNLTSLVHYLVRDSPIIMIFDARKYVDREAALERLHRMKKGPSSARTLDQPSSDA